MIDERQAEEQLPAEIRTALEKLDAEAHAAANRLDVSRVAARLEERLKAAQRVSASQRLNVSSSQRLIRIAAVLAVIAAGAFMLGREQPVPVAGLPVSIESADVADSQAVLNVVNEVRAQADSVVVLAGAVTVDDLSEQELRALLQALENEESL